MPLQTKLMASEIHIFILTGNLLTNILTTSKDIKIMERSKDDSYNDDYFSFVDLQNCPFLPPFTRSDLNPQFFRFSDVQCYNAAQALARASPSAQRWEL